MKLEEISIPEAFSLSPPGSAGVLCMHAQDSATELIAVDWFSWLNLKHQPLLSCAVRRDLLSGRKLSEDEELLLAVVPASELEKYRSGVCIPAEAPPEGLPMSIPLKTALVLRCTVFGQYNYPFKKIRIVNLNLLNVCKVL